MLAGCQVSGLGNLGYPTADIEKIWKQLYDILLEGDTLYAKYGAALTGEYAWLKDAWPTNSRKWKEQYLKDVKGATYLVDSWYDGGVNNLKQAQTYFAALSAAGVAASKAAEKPGAKKEDLEKVQATILGIQKLANEATQRSEAALRDLAKYKSSEPNYQVWVDLVARDRARLTSWQADPKMAYQAFTNRDTADRFIKGQEATADMLRAATTKHGISFWDGFWENLGKRYVEMLNNLPTLKDTLNMVPWIVAGIALVAAFPLIQALSKTGAKALGEAPRYRRRRLVTRF